MAVTVDLDTGEVGFVDDVCPDCGEPMYSSGCEAPGCTGFGCPDCGVGCDLDFADDGWCAAALAAVDADEEEDWLPAVRPVDTVDTGGLT